MSNSNYSIYKKKTTTKIVTVAIKLIFSSHPLLRKTNGKLFGKLKIRKKPTPRVNAAFMIGTSLFLVLLSLNSILPNAVANHEIVNVDYTFTANPESGTAPLTVTYTFTLANNGNTPVEAGPKTPRQSNCSPVTFGGSDNNGNNELDPREVWTASCSTTVTQDTVNRMSFSYSYCIDNHDGTFTCRNFDFIQLRAPVDITSLFGTDDDDTIFGTDDGETIFARGGDDKVYSYGGSDTIYGSYGDDPRLDGGNGDDVIDGGHDRDVITGEAGSDQLIGGTENDWIAGKDGDDWIWGCGNDCYELNLVDGNDEIYGDHGNDRIFGDSGDDRIDGGLGNNIVRGGTGNDIIITYNSTDDIDGEVGNDRIYTYGGSHTLKGGAGDDEIHATDGNDYIDCGPGNDIASQRPGSTYVACEQFFR
jgi:Ca2+-binding RTX toxin-like protein